MGAGFLGIYKNSFILSPKTRRCMENFSRCRKKSSQVLGVWPNHSSSFIL